MKPRIVSLTAGIAFGAILWLTAPPVLAGPPGNDVPKAPPFQSIGIHQVMLGVDHVRPDLLGMEVFIPTGSADPHCLVTFAETNAYPWPDVVFCNSRSQEIGGKLVEGLRLAIMYPRPLVDPGYVLAEYGLVVNVYQEGAKYYGEPVFYTGP